MALAVKQDSNFTGLRYAVEATPGVLPGSPVWIELEPNAYKSFGGTIKTKARNPINASRQRKKGVVIDLDSAAEFDQDVTATNVQALMEGFMFAVSRNKTNLDVATVAGSTHKYEPAAGGAAFTAGDLLFAEDFDSATNNGLKVVSGTPDATNVVVTDTGLVDGVTQSGRITRVGYQFGSGEATINSTASEFPQLVSTGRDLTTLGVIPGEFVYIGGDTTVTQFATAENLGFARVRSVTATIMTFDKTQFVMADDAGAAKTIQIFLGHVLKNESDPTLIVTKTIQMERTLGAPDTAQPTQIQAEYITRCIANEAKLGQKTADIATLDFSFMGADNETRTGAEGVKSGSRPPLVDTDAFNTVSDLSLIKMATVVDGDSCPTPLFAFLTDLEVDIKNNVKLNKALGVLGSFSASPGTFEVSATVTAYFQTVDAIQQARNNASVTLEQHMVKNNRGITLDMPLLSLAKVAADVKQDEAITLPISSDAATAKLIHPTLDYTALWMFWTYLPAAAE